MSNLSLLTSCTLCPRQCGVNRLMGERGYCGAVGEGITIARAGLHQWEEPCISGTTENPHTGVCGSGTVFFSHCSLGCVYCQNDPISHNGVGKTVSIERLSEIFLELQGRRAANINLVSPTHYTPQIVAALELAKKKGLSIPVVHNGSGYERVEVLRLFEGLVDVYLPDFKYAKAAIGEKYSHVPDYPDAIKQSLREMVRQVGSPQFDQDGFMTRGVLVRHLLLPGLCEDACEIVRYLYEQYQNNIYLSLMSQFTPLPHLAAYPEINRKVTRWEYEDWVDYAKLLGVENGFIQEGEAAKESFIPAFDGEGVLPAAARCP